MFKQVLLILTLWSVDLLSQNSVLFQNFEYNQIILNNNNSYTAKKGTYEEQKILAFSYYHTQKHEICLQSTQYLHREFADKIDTSDYILLLQSLLINKDLKSAEATKNVLRTKFNYQIDNTNCGIDTNFIVKNLSGNSKDGEYDLQLLNNKVGYLTKIGSKSNITTKTWLGQSNFEIFKASVNDSSYNISESIIGDENKHFEFNGIDTFGNLIITTNDINSGIKRQLHPLQIKLLQKNATGWKIINTNLNEDHSNTAHLSISPNKQLVVFSSDRSGGIGSNDIYLAKILSHTRDSIAFDKPMNLGPVVNTKLKETYPIFTNDSVITFSSDGRFAFGGLDLLQYNLNSKKIDLLPAPFNSENDDINLRYYDSFYLLSSNRNETEYYNDDIYKLVKKAPFVPIKPKKISLLVQLINPVTNKALASQWIVIENTKSNSSATRSFYQTDSAGRVFITDFALADSIFNFAVSTEPCNFKYFSSTNFKIQKDTATILLSPSMRKLGDEIGSELQLNSIRYELDKFEITESSKRELNILATFLAKYPNINIELQSHTDSRGSDAYNLKLSNNRAKAAKDYVVSLGIKSDRIISVGFGETKLLNQCGNNVKCPENEHEINRRTEYVITKFNPCVIISKPVISEDSDSDKDGINDAIEGFFDSDNDGVPNYLDPQ